MRARVVARYRHEGRFAAGFVAGKLRHDPLTRILLRLGVDVSFGDVVDLGCGRGQFAALLLEAGLARQVIGVDASTRLLDQAERVLAGLPFKAFACDLTADPVCLPVDTTLLVDVLYQLPTRVQHDVLARAASSSGRLVLVRTPDPMRGSRALLSRALEQAGRLGWPQAGAHVNPRPVGELADTLRRCGFDVEQRDASAGTPFANLLLIAHRHLL